MDIFLSINNREQVIQLPVLPKEFKIPSPEKHEVFDSISLGEIKLIGPDGLRDFTIQSFFPAKDYPFSRDNAYKGWEYVEIIESWRARKLPMRIIITDTPINMAFVIDDFEYGEQDGTGDVYYSLSISEFKFIRLGARKVK